MIQSTYKLDKKYKSIKANKYIQLIKYDKKYKKKYRVVTNLPGLTVLP